MLDTIKGWINDALQWFLDLLLYIPRKTYELLLDALAAVFDAIPVPGFVDDVAGFVAALAGTDVAYFLGVFQVPYGCAAILSAYVFRFVLRRIPFIG